MNTIKKLLPYFYLLMGMIGCFDLGIYTVYTVYNIKPVDITSWILTPFFTLFFLFQFIKKIKEDL